MKKNTDKDVTMEIICLETILNYKMTSQEAKAYKVSCLYIDKLKKIFPNDSRYGYGKGDPRKKYLFKCCYTFLRENSFRLGEIEFPMYIQAQIDIIQFNAQRHGKAPNFAPTCILGDKAWNRWLVWKKLSTKKLAAAKTADESGVNINQFHIVSETLKHDKKMMTQRLKQLTKENVTNALKERSILRWIAIKQISPYYALLSPLLAEWLLEMKWNLDDMFHIDFNLYKPAIDQKLRDFFYAEFSHEF